MGVTTKSFGVTAKGDKVTLYKITNSKGLAANVIDYGAILQSLYVPDKNGRLDDVVLGFNSITPYEYNASFFGSTIGRNANRIGNAKFTINGKEYKLAPNDNEHNNLHSDFMTCFNKKMFKGEIIEGENAVRFTIDSPDMDQGFPGNLKASVIYRLTDDNALELEYTAVSDQDTIYNPTNHSYFNLAGESSGTAMGHKLYLNCSNFTPADDESIPTGEIRPVAGTPFDFTTPTVIGDRINDYSYDQLRFGGGYDHNFVIDKKEKGVELCAILSDEKSGRRMTCYTDLPGVQFYAGNFIAYQYGKTDKAYTRRCGVCLETQFFPDAINKENFESPILKAGEEFHSITRYAFDLI
ncbi:MAG: galactose mutarotase [Lachnospiraceae bacterium]|nr:galactose mutarotase [Lachnospiraceae bacterium]